ncbi:MAG: hypothetical protein RIR43_334, partial [Pseudomonadota bacterium]
FTDMSVSSSQRLDHQDAQFEAVHVLRAAAALLVVLYHVIVIGKWSGYPVQGTALLGRVGWVGVDLFLVISGFVIALSALRGYDRMGSAFRASFARRRLARIVPLYLLTAIVFLFLVEPSLLAQPARVLALHAATHLTFIHNLWPNTHGSINGPNWSVALEMQFYLLMVICTPWLVRIRPGLLLIGLTAVALSWRAGVSWVVGLGIEKAHLLHVYTSQLPGVLDAFGMGIVLAMLMTRRNRPWWLQPGWRSAGMWLLVFVLSYTLAFDIYWARAGYWDQFEMVVLWRSLLATVAVSLVAMAVTLPSSIQQAVWLWPLRYVGEISYGIYLWHLPVLLTLMTLPGFTGMRLFTGVLAGTFILSACSWHLMEKPLIDRWKSPPPH